MTSLQNLPFEVGREKSGSQAQLLKRKSQQYLSITEKHELIGEYEAHEVIGQGSFATVMNLHIIKVILTQYITGEAWKKFERWVTGCYQMRT